MATARAKTTEPRIYGPMFLVKDIARSVRFYKATLGLRGDAMGPWAEFRTGDCRLVLLDRAFYTRGTKLPMRKPGRTPPNTFVLALQVPDVVRMYRRLAAKGVRFESAPVEVPQMGNRVAHLRDPDGHLVELATMLTREDIARLKQRPS